MINDIVSFIVEEALILMPFLYVLGMLLKNTPKVPDWSIPWVLVILGAVAAPFVIKGDPVSDVIQGVLVAGATVLANQLIKQTNQKE
jgi:hypothetical protein